MPTLKQSSIFWVLKPIVTSIAVIVVNRRIQKIWAPYKSNTKKSSNSVVFFQRYHACWYQSIALGIITNFSKKELFF